MVNTNMHVFKHPKFYEEFRQRAKRCQKELKASQEKKSDQVISGVVSSSRAAGTRAPGQGQSAKRQAPSSESIKRQASSPKQQASSLNPQASSSKILEPRKSFTVLGPRASAMIKVLCGCFTWKAIWCGENFNFLPCVTFNSIVKKWPWLLLASISGVPSKLLFSSLISEKSLKVFLTFWYNLRSGPIVFSR